MALDLTPKQNRNFAQHFMISGVRLGLNNSEILNEIRSVGLTYGNSLFSADMATIRTSNPRLPSLTGAQLGMLTPVTGGARLLGSGATRYQYVFQARTRDPESGQYTGSVTWSFTSGQQHTDAFVQALGSSLAPQNYVADSYVNPNDIYSIQEIPIEQA